MRPQFQSTCLICGGPGVTHRPSFNQVHSDPRVCQTYLKEAQDRKNRELKAREEKLKNAEMALKKRQQRRSVFLFFSRWLP